VSDFTASETPTASPGSRCTSTTTSRSRRTSSAGRCLSGATNILQRNGVGEVSQSTGQKVFGFDGDEPLALRGPKLAGDADFGAAVAH
jgi:hypothetical protein